MARVFSVRAVALQNANPHILTAVKFLEREIFKSLGLVRGKIVQLF
jgi:hypothetical protein